MPDTGALIGTPPSINASVPAQTVAMDDEPFDSSFTDQADGVWAIIGEGNTGFKARSAKLPCPTSRQLVPRSGRSSPVENGGKL